MFPVIFRIGFLRIYSYGLMTALAFLVTGFILRKELKRAGFSPGLGDSIIIWAILGGIAGAKLYSVIEGLNDPNPVSLSTFFSGSGLVWYGGFAGGVIAVLIVIRRSGSPVMKVLDLVAPLLILGYAFGRMGCFLSGDGDYGPPTDLPWGMAFPNGIVPTTARVHPTPLYEIALLLIIFAFLWRVRRRNPPTGWMFGMYLVLAGVERFITEFWRLTSVIALGVTMAQITSIVSITVGSIIISRSWKARMAMRKVRVRDGRLRNID